MYLAGQYMSIGTGGTNRDADVGIQTTWIDKRRTDEEVQYTATKRETAMRSTRHRAVHNEQCDTD